MCNTLPRQPSQWFLFCGALYCPIIYIPCHTRQSSKDKKKEVLDRDIIIIKILKKKDLSTSCLRQMTLSIIWGLHQYLSKNLCSLCPWSIHRTLKWVCWKLSNREHNPLITQPPSKKRRGGVCVCRSANFVPLFCSCSCCSLSPLRSRSIFLLSKNITSLVIITLLPHRRVLSIEKSLHTPNTEDLIPGRLYLFTSSQCTYLT